MLSAEDWAEIRRLRRAEKLSVTQIARALRVSRNMVYAALESDGPTKFEAKPGGLDRGRGCAAHP